MGGSTLKAVKPHVSGQEAMWLINGSMSCCSECGIISLYVRCGDVCPGCGLQFITAGPINDSKDDWRMLERFGDQYFELPFQAELEAAQLAHHPPRKRRGGWLAKATTVLLLFSAVLLVVVLLGKATPWLNGDSVSCSDELVETTLNRHNADAVSHQAVLTNIAMARYDLHSYNYARVTERIERDNPGLKFEAGEIVKVPIECHNLK